MIFLFSCTAVFITEISRVENFNLKYVNKKTATVVALEDVRQGLFYNKFDGKYPQKNDFVANYTSQFAHKLKKAIIFSQVNLDTTHNWSVLKTGSISKKSFKLQDSLLKSCGSDYLICISEFEVSNHIQADKIGMAYNTTEYCVVSAHFQILDVNSHYYMLDFISSGEGIVILSAYDSALEEAINSSVRHAVAFMKTGNKRFIIHTTQLPTNIPIRF